MNEDEDTLTEVTNAIEKPKRKATEKQLAALASAREKRKTKPNALAQTNLAQSLSKVDLKQEPIGKVVYLPEPEPIVVKKPKTKKAPPKPIIIQMEDDSSSSDDEPPATVIIRNTRKPAKAKPKPEPVQEAYRPPTPPRQYIRRA
jgi:hypothetical protein